MPSTTEIDYKNVVATGATHWPLLEAAQSFQGRFTRPELKDKLDIYTMIFNSRFYDLSGASGLIELATNSQRTSVYRTNAKYRVTALGKSIASAEQLEAYFVHARGGFSVDQVK